MAESLAFTGMGARRIPTNFGRLMLIFYLIQSLNPQKQILTYKHGDTRAS